VEKRKGGCGAKKLVVDSKLKFESQGILFFSGTGKRVYE
jgi:hypothetical protein